MNCTCGLLELIAHAGMDPRMGHPKSCPMHYCTHPRQVTPEDMYTIFRCLDCGVYGKVAEP